MARSWDTSPTATTEVPHLRAAALRARRAMEAPAHAARDRRVPLSGGRREADADVGRVWSCSVRERRAPRAPRAVRRDRCERERDRRSTSGEDDREDWSHHGRGGAEAGATAYSPSTLVLLVPGAVVSPPSGHPAALFFVFNIDSMYRFVWAADAPRDSSRCRDTAAGHLNIPQ